MTACKRRVCWMTAGFGLAIASCSGSEDGARHQSTPEAVVDEPEPTMLDPNMVASEGIYADVALGTVAADALEFTPDYPLWSDGAEKRRWVFLPEGTQIDTSDMDHWRFPIGTKFVKEFSLNGVRLETRVIEHVADTGRTKKDLTLKVYVWNEAQDDALLTKDGATDLFGTQHDVPKQKDCIACHVGEPSGTLGFSAVQLSESGMLAELEQRGLLSDPPGRTFALPGTDAERSAIGWLHANCGHCHAEGTPADVMRLRVLVSELDAPWSDSQLYQTTLGQAISKWSPRPEGFDTRVVPGFPEQSALVYRMERRDSETSEGEQMPPLATELVDEDALAAVRAWIAAMPASPAPATMDGGAAPPDGGDMDRSTSELDQDGGTAQADAGTTVAEQDAENTTDAELDAGVDAEADALDAAQPPDAAPDADGVDGGGLPLDDGAMAPNDVSPEVAGDA